MHKYLTYFIVIAMSSLCGNSFAIETNHKFMKSLATLYPHTPVYPIRYFSFTRELNSQNQETSEFSESWDLELPANSAKDAVLYSLATFNGQTKYKELSINVIGRDKKEVSLPIEFETLEVADEKGVKMTGAVPFSRIPLSKDTKRIVVRFKIEVKKGDALEIYGQKLQLPDTIPVDKAMLVLRSDASSSANGNFENRGFEVTQNVNNNGQLLQTFVLKEKWLPKKNEQKFDAPKVVLSFKTWSEIAKRHGEFYQTALARDDEITFSSLNIASALLEEKTQEHNREIAFHLFKWIGNNVEYFATGLNFDLDLKHKPQSIEQIMKKKSGDCKDFALLYIKLLALAGIYAEPVEVMLSDNFGPIPISNTVPRDFLFNHVIVYIPEFDDYIDPTSSNKEQMSSSNFSVHSARYSNTYGMHLFSQKLELIKPNLIAKDIQVKTSIQRQQGKWIGSTNINGKNGGLITLNLLQERRDKLIKRGKGFDNVFRKNHYEQIPESWIFKKDDIHGYGTISFSYEIKHAPVDDDGKIKFIPINVLAALLRFYSSEEIQTNGEFSFGSEVIEQIVEIIGVKDIQIANQLREVQIMGVNSKFTQKISIDGENLRLHRRFFTQEKRMFFTNFELERQIKFYREIKAITTATDAHNE